MPSLMTISLRWRMHSARTNIVGNQLGPCFALLTLVSVGQHARGKSVTEWIPAHNTKQTNKRTQEKYKYFVR